MQTTYLASDNQAGAHPSVLEAVARHSAGRVPAYGDDAITQSVVTRIQALFETDCEVFLVATGTAANSLVLSAMCPPWGAILCHNEAHIYCDENTAPEFFTGGARQIGVSGDLGRPSIEEIRRRVATARANGVHNPKPAVISLTNSTERGTVINTDEIHEYAQTASELGLALHVDGARFSNAVVSTGASPADLTWRSGVDALTFGATKNGAIAAEAVVFFNKTFSEQFAFRRKRAGHLWSKHRFLAAQFDAFLSDDLWRHNARHANKLAAQLARGLSDIPGVQLPWPTQSNEVFPVLSPAIDVALKKAGFDYYDWPIVEGMVRLVTSFATDPADIERCLTVARTAAQSAGQL